MQRKLNLAQALLMVLLAAPETAAAQARESEPVEGAAPNSLSNEAVVPLVVLEFRAQQIPLEGGDPFASLSALTADPHLARLIATAGADGGVSGALVFEGVDAFRAWNDGEGSGFFDPLGEGASVERTLKVWRDDLVGYLADQGGLGSLDGLSIEYTNTDNDAAGDADIDAVTVVCSGTDADCKPSN